MRSIRSYLALAALVLVGLPVFAQVTVQDSPKQAAEANNMFGADIFARLLAARGPDANLVFSPHSLAAALHLVAPGAGGETADAFAKILRMGKSPATDALAGQGALQRSLNGAGDVTLRLANGLWSAADTPLKSDYISKLKQMLDAELAPLPADPVAAAARINAWVSNQTKGAIPTLFDRLPAETRAVLVNALYFKADWATGFEAAQTQDLPFRLAAGGNVVVPMMHRRDEAYRYRETKTYQAVNLAYRGERFQLLVVLPKAGGAMPNVAQPDVLKELLTQSGYRRAPGLVGLPKLNLRDTLPLNDPLQAAGLGIAFTDRADFSALAERPLLISQVLQRTKLEIDEKGTTAAAATGITMAPTSIREPVPPFTLICDRPYLLLLHDSHSGAVLFMAYIGNPKASGN